jgi:hypothetical protein
MLVVESGINDADDEYIRWQIDDIMMFVSAPCVFLLAL